MNRKSTQTILPPPNIDELEVEDSCFPMLPKSNVSHLKPLPTKEEVRRKINEAVIRLVNKWMMQKKEVDRSSEIDTFRPPAKRSKAIS